MLRRILAGIIVAGLLLGMPPSLLAADVAPFTLVKGTVSDASGGAAEAMFPLGPVFGAITIAVSPVSGRYSVEASTEGIPIALEGDGLSIAGDADVEVLGTYDPDTGAVTGTATIVQREVIGTSGAAGGDMKFDESRTWTPKVSGKIGPESASLVFDGPYTGTCKEVTHVTGGCSPSFTGTQRATVTFAVTGGAAAEFASPITPTTQVLGVTRDVSGDVYISPASEADLEPGARHFQRVKPGQRLALEEGAMLRTGRDGTVAILFSTGALSRLGPSTLLGMQKFETVKTPLSVMYGRLFEGIAWFYMQKWKESGKKFEMETDRAIVGIKGTTFEVAVTAGATVVTVAEGVVTLTDKATGTTIDVGPSERATVDAAGMTKTAAPDAVALLNENAPPGAELPLTSAAADATPAPVAAASSGAGAAASPAPAAPSNSDSGGSSLPIVIGIVAVVVIVVVVAAILLRRKRT